MLEVDGLSRPGCVLGVRCEASVNLWPAKLPGSCFYYWRGNDRCHQLGVRARCAYGLVECRYRERVPGTSCEVEHNRGCQPTVERTYADQRS